MTVNQIILYILAAGAALGGIDQILGNRRGYGTLFERGFQMLGSVGLSMAGILCLAPVLSQILGPLVGPLCDLLRIDPGVFGSILAIDMGGCPLSIDLAKDPQFGRFSGIILSSIFGATLVFTLPVGVGFLQNEDRTWFIRGILLGLTTMPFSIVTAGLMLGMNLLPLLWNCIPVLLVSALLALGVIKKPEKMLKLFQTFAKIIRKAGTFGLAAAAITHMTGIPVIPGMLPLQEAMQTVSAICIVMLGSMPLAEFIQRVMKVPFQKISEKTGLNSASTTALLLSLVTATPALAMLPKMNRRGQVVMTACMVSSLCTFGAHFAFTNNLYPDMVPALLTAKLLGGLLGGVLAMIATRNLKETSDA